MKTFFPSLLCLAALCVTAPEANATHRNARVAVGINFGYHAPVQSFGAFSAPYAPPVQQSFVQGSFAQGGCVQDAFGNTSCGVQQNFSTFQGGYSAAPVLAPAVSYRGFSLGVGGYGVGVNAFRSAYGVSGFRPFRAVRVFAGRDVFGRPVFRTVVR